MSTTARPVLHNPHLEGDPFCWEGGPSAILLIHGLTATPTEVRPLAKRLHSTGYTVAGPLLPGHRETPAALNRTHWQDWYSAVETAYLELASRHEVVYVGGESCGGLLALLLAALYPQIAGVLAYAPALRLKLSPLEVFALDVIAPFVSSVSKPHVLENTTWQGYPVNPLQAIRQLRKLQAVVMAELPNVRQPLLVLQGCKDITIDQQSSQIVFDRASSPIKEIHWLEQSDHCLLLDCELDLATRLTFAFLQVTTK